MEQAKTYDQFTDLRQIIARRKHEMEQKI
jgi:hypothetical protein